MYFCNFIQQRLRADDFQIPPHRQAVAVVSQLLGRPYNRCPFLLPAGWVHKMEATFLARYFAPFWRRKKEKLRSSKSPTAPVKARFQTAKAVSFSKFGLWRDKGKFVKRYFSFFWGEKNGGMWTTGRKCPISINSQPFPADKQATSPIVNWQNSLFSKKVRLSGTTPLQLRTTCALATCSFVARR